MKRLLPFFLLLSCASCGYRAGVGKAEYLHKGVCIPYVEGDLEGVFTSELTYVLKRSGLFSDQKKAASLRVKICAQMDQDIGWREDFEDTKDEKRVVVDEKRRIIVLEVSLCKEGQIVWGPKKIRSFVDYDFVDPDSLNDLSFLLGDKREPVLSFSLGQLTSEDSAVHSSLSSLYRKLAEKIVDQICLEW